MKKSWLTLFLFQGLFICNMTKANSNEVKLNHIANQNINANSKDTINNNKGLDAVLKLSNQIEKHLLQESKLSLQKQELDLSIANLAEEIKDTETELRERKKELSFKVRYITGSSTSDFLRNLFESKNAGELEKNFRFMGMIINNDMKLIQIVKQKTIELSNKKELLIGRYSAISELEKKLKKEENLLRKQLSLKNKILTKIKRTQLKTFVDLRGVLKWPASGKVTQTFGIMKDPITRVHLPFQGIFIETNPKSTVKSISKGTVSYIHQPNTLTDTTVVIHHDGPYYSVYGSLSDVQVSVGEIINEGQIIGTPSKGTFLYNFKPGVYFELREGLQAKDPLKWLVAEQLNKTQNENWENIQ